MEKKLKHPMMEKIMTIAEVMKEKIGWSSLLVHADANGNIIAFSIGKESNWEESIETTYEAQIEDISVPESTH